MKGVIVMNRGGFFCGFAKWAPGSTFSRRLEECSLKQQTRRHGKGQNTVSAWAQRPWGFTLTLAAGSCVLTWHTCNSVFLGFFSFFFPPTKVFGFPTYLAHNSFVELKRANRLELKKKQQKKTKTGKSVACCKRLNVHSVFIFHLLMYVDVH